MHQTLPVYSYTVAIILMVLVIVDLDAATYS